MFWKINAEVSTWFWDIITVAGAGKKAKNDYKPAKKIHEYAYENKLSLLKQGSEPGKFSLSRC